MRFEPVFVAPSDSRSRSGVSRRAFVGGVLGSLGLGSVLGARSRRVEPLAASDADHRAHDSASPALPFVEDCLALAEAPLPELVAGSALFFVVFGATEDARLLPGLERLAVAVCGNHPATLRQRATLAAALTAEISSRASARAALANHLPRLRTIR